MSDLRATVDDVMRWGPGDGYDREYVEALWDGRESLSALEILDLDSPAEVRLWAVLREELVPAPLLHEFACRVAERALQREREAGREPDPRSWAAVAAKRDWLAGRIGREELRTARDAAWAAEDAARDATWATWAATRAAWEAAWDAAWATETAADWVTEWVEAWSYAEDAGRSAQLEILCQMLREEEE